MIKPNRPRAAARAVRCVKCSTPYRAVATFNTVSYYRPQCDCKAFKLKKVSRDSLQLAVDVQSRIERGEQSLAAKAGKKQIAPRHPPMG